MDRYPWEMGKKGSTSYTCPNLLPWKFLGCDAERGKPGKTWQTLSGTHEAESPKWTWWLETKRQSTGEEWEAQRQNSRDLQKVHIDSAWVLINTLYEKTTQDQEKDHFKGLKVIEPITHKRSVIVSMPKSQRT